MQRLSESGQHDVDRSTNDETQPMRLTRGLAWFSVALGVAGLLAPRSLSRVAGIDERVGFMRLLSIRELACGVGILASRNRAPYLWARVGGDLLDLGAIGATATDSNRARRSALAVGGVLALDVYTARRASNKRLDAATRQAVHDYSNRHGFPRPPEEMRGAARETFETPRDMRGPDALRPWRDRLA